MKKIFLLLFLSLFSVGFAQKKKKTKAKAVTEKQTVIIYTEADAESSSEPRIIAGFLKQNPGHEKTNYFKKKLVQIIMADNSPEAKPTIKPVSKDKLAKIVTNNELNKSVANNTSNKSISTPLNTASPQREVNYAGVGNTSKKAEPSDKSKKTAAMLSHMFNYDPNDKEAYIIIKNRSKCELVVKINGKKYYNLTVPARGESFVMVDRGEYILTTMVCDAKYSSLKKITKDIEIELNVAD